MSVTHGDKIILAGYLVRCPLGGYAWQILHYLVGLRALGFDPYFYEDTAYYGDCFDPLTGNMHVAPDAGVAFAADFFGQFGFGDRWAFWDAARNRHHGLNAADTVALLHDARLLITLAAVNRVPRQPGQRRVFIDIDPTFTQIRVADGDTGLCELLDEHDAHFTIGENIGTAGCVIPTDRFAWKPTRQPIAVELWSPLPSDPAAAFTTIGRWDERRRDVHFQGNVYAWSKRVEWMKFLDLPQRTGERFTVAMDVDKSPADGDLLRRHGWEILDPIAVSANAFTYRDFIRRSKAEFTVAKDLNVRLASGWFSDRAACYLAAGRPVVTQDTGFGRCLPTGKGLFAVRTLDDATAACTAIASDYDTHARAARRGAEEHFSARRVLADVIAAL
ncbi:MAG: hypothetical protein ACHQ4J_15635 [Candidatus Binatia bacterium]